jgi:hypothetical protein
VLAGLVLAATVLKPDASAATTDATSWQEAYDQAPSAVAAEEQCA